MNFDPKKWKVYTWKHWMVIHWMLNPALAINELILGQRVPKISLVDKQSNKPKIERSYVPCPHCGKLHDSRIWLVEETSFKNWFGLYCTHCGNIIPCVMNIFSLIILTLTYPFWSWFRKSLKRNWLEKQPHRYASIDVENLPNLYAGLGWIKQGLTFGAFMFFFTIIVSLITSKGQITQKEILVEIPIWLIGGLLFGGIMKLMMYNMSSHEA